MSQSPYYPIKRVVGGKTYNTETAKLVARYEYEEDKDEIQRHLDVTAEVYKTQGGAFFIVHHETVTDIDTRNTNPHYQPNTRETIEPVSHRELEALLGHSGHAIEILDESRLPAPPEAEAEDDEAPAATLYLRVPLSLKNRIESAARKSRQSVNSWARQELEKACAEPSASP